MERVPGRCGQGVVVRGPTKWTTALIRRDAFNPEPLSHSRHNNPLKTIRDPRCKSNEETFAKEAATPGEDNSVIARCSGGHQETANA